MASRVAAPVTTGTRVRRLLVVAYLGLLVVWPVGLVVRRTFEGGGENLTTALSDPVVTSALQLTVVVALWAVAINTVFGIGISLLLVRQEFPGKRVLSALIDLPLSVSPVVVGLALLLAYGGTDGLFGPGLESAGLQVVFATPAIVLATAFITLPLVIREIVPVLTEIGTDQEQAARSLGAGGWQTFRRITLPSIRWALVYGVVLSLARALGEFGAVKIVSGNLIGQTQTATLVVEQKYQDFEQGTAYATSFLLALIAVAALVVVAILRPQENSDGH
ncbi:putative sulfate ABC transporter, permease protein CysW [Aeromicrobium marinum DSM 15272]|uniref:Sulfate ABC transporter, permease protein CysW n=1 Tax=Aeromicrobium marinum DSM 15272 TaxID=585531 RepID=E2SFV9_9ACTN|nr:sulfate ABC transporter permease subunit [Aeromicrobium marinum]EFQ81906.1 putative sulfate ABC transporter, permease protein CysW [Aeromicrobium marinum DSM 15272]